ncbi:hypothetical protein [Bradyrhizobium sp. 2TAF24]|uniref:hypothetical protein n=1 Tax=Bradyrhizobium sp. 2TAF24 TaxID=3233011 RepID=UPI003F918C55
MGLLDDLYTQSGIPWTWGGTSGGFPAADPQADPRAIWDQIDARTAADSAPGLTRGPSEPYTPFPVPDQTNPGIATALGRQSFDFGAYGSPKPEGFGVGLAIPAQSGATNVVSPTSAPANAGAPRLNAPTGPAPNAPDPVDGAPMPPRSPAAGSPPGGPQPQAASPGLGDRLLAGLSGFANAKGFLGAVSNGVQGLVTGQTPETLTARALLARGASPEDVAAAARSPDVLQQLLNRYYGKERFTASTIGRNSGGQPIYGAFDTQTGEARPFPFGSGRLPSGPPANGAPAPGNAPPQSGRAAGATAFPSQSANGRPQDSVVAATIANAKAAVAAHPEIRGAVIARLRAYGIDASGI